ncbi:MAG TPA: nuclear transport factor 2 family protein [Candidatus Acidoferrum sp.]|jgi:ketosteroid isomerase-like protein
MNFVLGRRTILRIYAVTSILVVFSLFAVPAHTQQKSKKKKNEAPAVDNNSANPIVPLTDEQQIDYLISEVLGAWQIGDSARMHKNYSDDVSVVNGGWAPPVLGWANYEALYKLQRAKMQQVRMDRSNTYIKVNGNTAWACFQWEFAAVIDGSPSAARGHTTYIFIKKDNHWLIAHDHTSIVQTAHQTAPGTAPSSSAEPPKPAS